MCYWTKMINLLEELILVTYMVGFDDKIQPHIKKVKSKKKLGLL